ncbi:MAG: tRNA (guanine(26)-N(2))-dimethyltransferase [Candidatus Aenigmarchaeota archaeon]|nr:tRNA (guanine(26)-N(2))-dimethyltransferase [Candidatus Aenigmarchaeota archaeon]
MTEIKIPVKEIREGLTKLIIPRDYLKKIHFFNPRVELSRDMTILVLNTLNPKDWIVCDVLAGIGARGIRIAKECRVKKVFLNDISEDNIPLMRKNISLNLLKNKVNIINRDANQILSDNIRLFDYIDIDPWGSPSYYFDSVARAIKRKGFIGFSATDTAALCGTSPITCLRRYGIESYKTDFFKELGLRILIANAALTFGKWSFSFKPLLSYASEHYFRVFAEVEKGKSIASKTLEQNLGYVNYCSKCLWRKIDEEPIIKCEFCDSKTKVIGKIWTGKIEELKFLQTCLEELIQTNWLKTENKIKNLISLLKNETIPFYYDVHRICQKNKFEIPKFEILQQKLRDKGNVAERTHFSYKGIKTDLSLKEMIETISEF